MSLLDAASAVLLACGAFFLVAGTVGLVRFPDLYSRLHAVTKADNVGLGLTALALVLRAGSWSEALKLGLVWILVLASSGTVCFLLGNEARRRGLPPWTRTAP